jgi:hypothetical protein
VCVIERHKLNLSVGGVAPFENDALDVALLEQCSTSEPSRTCPDHHHGCHFHFWQFMREARDAHAIGTWQVIHRLKHHAEIGQK